MSQDQNTTPNLIDEIENIRISVTTANYTDFFVLDAIETGPDTGLFQFDFGRGPRIDNGDERLNFAYGDPILVENILLSGPDGEKTISANFYHSVDSVGDSDDIFLDTAAPVVTNSSSPSTAPTNDTTPFFSWVEPPDESGISLYLFQLVDSSGISLHLQGNLTLSSYNPPLVLDDGVYSWRVQATDAAGNAGPFSQLFSFEIDTEAPDPPIITYPSQNLFINNSRINVSGTAEEPGILVLFLDENLVDTIDIAEGGNWQYQHNLPLDDGPHSVYAMVEDRSGNSSDESEVIRFTVSTNQESHVNLEDGLGLLESAGIIIEEILGNSVMIDSTNIEAPQAGIDPITVTGHIVSSDPNPTVRIDWNDGTDPTDAVLTGNSWSATHTFASQGDKEVIARLILSGEEVSSAIYNINVRGPSLFELIALGSATGVAAPVSVIEFKYKPIRNSVEKIKLWFGFYVKGGIEREQTIKEANAKFAQLVETGHANDGADDNTQQVSNNTVDSLKESLAMIKETLYTIKDATEITALSVEGHTNPDRILSSMANEGISKMLGSLAPLYGTFFIKEITINSELQILKRSRSGERKVDTEINIDMEPLYPFIEAGFKLGEAPAKAVRVVFKLDTSVNVGKLELKITPENKVQIDLEDVVVHLKLLLHKIYPVGLGLPFSMGSGGSVLGREVNLVKREFRLDRITTKDKKEQTTESGPVAPTPGGTAEKLEDRLREVYCDICQATVRVVRFCPECGNILVR